MLQHGIVLQHLTPNYITQLSIFAYMCEQFIGIKPCLELFRAFYLCQKTNKSTNITGFCHLRL